MDRKPTLNRGIAMSAIYAQTQKILSQEGVILYPTDTLWGLGCDATSTKAVERIYKLKNRPKDKAYILLVCDLEMAHHYVGSIHPKIDRLLHFHDRPLTVVYPSTQNLPAISYAADGSVAIRIVKDPFCRQLISNLGKPLVATSANISDAPFPKHFGEISSAVIAGVDYVTPYRQNDQQMGEPSVMVTLSDKDELVFLRN